MTLAYRRGTGLIDVIVGVSLLLIVFTSLFGLLEVTVRLSTLAKAKAAATVLATTQMEYLRSLPYSSLGTVSGTPSGTIPDSATTTVQGAPYVVETRISYYDDPADGQGAADSNNAPNDYKQVLVRVSYTIHAATSTVSLASIFAPSGVETP